MSLSFVPHSDATIPLFLVAAEDLDGFLAPRPEVETSWLKANGFSAGAESICMIPGASGFVAAVAGLGTQRTRSRSRFTLGAVRQKLPEGLYRLETTLRGEALDEQLLGWLLSGYVFDKYKEKKTTLGATYRSGRC